MVAPGWPGTRRAEGEEEDRPLRRPTMRDVANSAGVSLKTVSRVINAEPACARSRERVESAIAELGFQRNDLAPLAAAGPVPSGS